MEKEVSYPRLILRSAVVLGAAAIMGTVLKWRSGDQKAQPQREVWEPLFPEGRATDTPPEAA